MLKTRLKNLSIPKLKKTIPLKTPDSINLVIYNSIAQKIELVKSRQLSLTENVQSFLNRITASADLNAMTEVFPDEALSAASRIEQKILSGAHGKLAGAVIAVKDVLSLEGKKLTCGSKILDNFTALYTATTVQKLIDEDAIIIGKTNCDEFAMGSSNENSAHGPVKNPINSEYVPGGSSGGSAAALAAGFCDIAIGTDTGGSIRQPASFCGLFGLKPTYSLVSRYGLTAFASSFDSVGPFANSIEDIALCLQVLAGFDERDSTSAQRETPDYVSGLQEKSNPLVIGLPEEYFAEGLNEEVRGAIEEKIARLKSAGYTFQSVSLPMTKEAIAVYYILTMAEASSNLARYDGARYGKRSPEAVNLDEMYRNSRSENLGAEVKRRIMLGTYILSAGYYDAYYKKAQQVRRLIKEDFERAFTEVDVLLTPTSPFTAFKIGEKSSDPLAMYLSDIYTTSANLAGIPGINIPIGKDAKGLPIGLQLLGKEFGEMDILKVGKAVAESPVE
ncbi:MAG: Asp-tRNA(Asn)/Glu-tRNA(Gln) amidotransferase subunit GatA [Ignavibacteriales bacterium]|nr:Asp-tRNA(Asn)/Glu-tRNA(Gln) amidotransferase subunit GatA [Ignavibacteriales bacterium]